MIVHLSLLNNAVICLKVQFIAKQLHCYRNIHMYDFHDDARNHHGSQCKH